MDCTWSLTWPGSLFGMALPRRVPNEMCRLSGRHFLRILLLGLRLVNLPDTVEDVSARKKLTCSDRATNSRPCRSTAQAASGDSSTSLAKIRQALDEALFLLVSGAAIEVIATEVLVYRAVLERVVDGKRLMSMPISISETATCALRFLMPGVDMGNSTTVRRARGFFHLRIGRRHGGVEGIDMFAAGNDGAR
jgi:hypothetical protein